MYVRINMMKREKTLYNVNYLSDRACYLVLCNRIISKVPVFG